MVLTPAPDVWNPDLYGRFRDERAAPFRDLLALLEPAERPRVLDLGCGTGELTRLAHERLAARETVGVDSSAAMLARAAAHAGGGLSFRQGDLAAFSDPAPFDVVLSNAAIHWVPDHAALLPRLLGLVAPGGQLAIQAPANDHHPAFAASRAAAEEPELAGPLGGFVRRSPVLDPEAYAHLLFRQGVARQRVRQEVYAHALASRDDVAEWLRGTTLTDYEKRLDGPTFARFLARYRERLAEVLPDERPFLFTFRRVFLGARR